MRETSIEVFHTAGDIFAIKISPAVWKTAVSFHLDASLQRCRGEASD